MVAVTIIILVKDLDANIVNMSWGYPTTISMLTNSSIIYIKIN